MLRIGADDTTRSPGSAPTLHAHLQLPARTSKGERPGWSPKRPARRVTESWPRGALLPVLPSRESYPTRLPHRYPRRMGPTGSTSMGRCAASPKVDAGRGCVRCGGHLVSGHRRGLILRGGPSTSHHASWAPRSFAKWTSRSPPPPTGTKDNHHRAPARHTSWTGIPAARARFLFLVLGAGAALRQARGASAQDSSRVMSEAIDARAR